MKESPYSDAVMTLRTMRTLFRHGATDIAEKVCLEFFEVHNAKSSCLHCGEVIVTGTGTGRRSSAKYCSDRCRVASMRERKKAEAKSK